MTQIEEVPLRDNVLLIRTRHAKTCHLVLFGGRMNICTCHTDEKKIWTGHNLVYDAGDQFYAQHVAKSLARTVPTITNAFTTAELANNSGTNPAPGKALDRGDRTSIVASSQKAWSAGYARVDDPDADNTGAGPDILSWLFEWTPSDFNATGISDIWITTAAAAGSEPILSHIDENVWTPSGVFTKASTDSLKFFLNHRLNGV